jgi:hypothetical protein
MSVICLRRCPLKKVVAGTCQPFDVFEAMILGPMILTGW